MSYTSEHIKVLKGLEAVRVRPGMYIGDTDSGSGLHHMIYEITDNSVDEALAGHCTKIKIVLHSDGSVSVSDNGRGIPVDMHQEEQKSAAELIMTQLHAGGKFDSNSYKISGGLHGVGASVVNALSTRLELVIAREQKLYYMSFAQGQVVDSLEQISAYHSDFVQDHTFSLTQGTYIRFIPDPTIFSMVDFSYATLAKRYQELSYLNPGLIFELSQIHMRDGKKSVTKETFCDKGGVSSFVRQLAAHNNIGEIIQVTGALNDVQLDLALAWSDNYYQDNTLCFTNNIPQRDGGTHLQGFRSALTKAVQKFIPESKTKDLQVTGEDIREGMFAVLSIKIPDPKFSSQTKDKLVSQNVRAPIEQLVHDKIYRFLEENPAIMRATVDRILESIRAKEAARKARDLVRKNKDNSISVAGKLADCSVKDPARRELFLVEGQSAGGTAKMARNRENQSVLALQGKLLNVEKATLNKILEYEAIRVLITVLGCGVGDQCDPSLCKYHKIIIMTDADVDGSHIRTLLLTFFFRYMKPIVSAGYVYVSRPPLFAIKSKNRPHVYIADQSGLEKYIADNTGKLVQIYPYHDTADHSMHTGNDISIDPLNMADKELFYRNALQAFYELKQFKKLAPDVVASGMLTDLDLDKLLTHLQKRFTEVTIATDHNRWHVTVKEFDRQYHYHVNFKPLTATSTAFILGWQPIIVQVHGKKHMCQTIFDLQNIIDNIQSNSFEISRFKGLGEMNPNELKETGIDARTRIIEQIQAPDEDQADHMIKLLMGDDVPGRRLFIETHALAAMVDA